MSEALVLSAVADSVATVTLNRPDRMNAWTPRDGGRLLDLVDSLDDDPDVRAVVLTGAGRGFCPGLDAGDLAARTQGGAGQEGGDRPMTHARPCASHSSPPSTAAAPASGSCRLWSPICASRPRA